MFDLSIAFKQRGENEHLFFSGFAYVSKAYLVNDEEKNAILKILNSLMKELFLCASVLAYSSTAQKSHIFLYSAIFLAFNCIRFLMVRKQIKKILGNRVKIPCEKQTFVGYHQRIANTYTWKFLAQLVVSAIIIFITGVVLFLQYKKTGILANFIGSILCISAGSVVAALLIFQNYLKQKNQK